MILKKRPSRGGVTGWRQTGLMWERGDREERKLFLAAVRRRKGPGLARGTVTAEKKKDEGPEDLLGDAGH